MRCVELCKCRLNQVIFLATCNGTNAVDHCHLPVKHPMFATCDAMPWFAAICKKFGIVLYFSQRCETRGRVASSGKFENLWRPFCNSQCCPVAFQVAQKIQMKQVPTFYCITVRKHHCQIQEKCNYPLLFANCKTRGCCKSWKKLKPLCQDCNSSIFPTTWQVTIFFQGSS